MRAKGQDDCWAWVAVVEGWETADCQTHTVEPVRGDDGWAGVRKQVMRKKNGGKGEWAKGKS